MIIHPLGTPSPSFQLEALLIRLILGTSWSFPLLTAAWEHEYFYSGLPITANFAAFSGQNATVFGPSEGHDSAIVNAGAAFKLTPRISTYLRYQGQLRRDHYNANAVTGGFTFSF
jgi:outer membrane autotransporter protein